MSDLRWGAADEMQRDIETFVSLFVHDIRSPLTTAAGVAETLQRHNGRLDEALKSELLEAVRTSVGRIEEITMEAERLQTTRVSLTRAEPESVPVSALLRELVSDTRQPPCIELDVDDVVVSLLREAVEQAVTEMLANVADHTPFGTSARVRAKAIGDREILITVEDDGPGVPLEFRERIFAPYCRGRAAPAQGGYGLGLAVVDQVAAAHDGGAWVEESPGGGASFRLLLRGLD
ncbi:MAG: ATP-binding protein [Nitriliruptorales bacterium]|nr:ATP-binding protein [Nitriliruptorales bacterium]